MKFANIDSNSFALRNGKVNGYLNFGDHIQIAAIDNLYHYMGIKKESVVRISYYDLSTYSGEQLILPVNFMLYWMPLPSGDLVSPDIIPVFLGASFPNDMPAHVFEAMKKWEPIGCRDEGTYRCFQEHGISSYLAGCLTVALPTKEYDTQKQNGKVFLIDAPQEMIPYIPQALKKEMIVDTNEFIGLFEKDMSQEEYAKNRYKRLAQEASLVITSRLHVAAPCVAMGIPVIVCLREMDSRFSWLEKYIPIYLKKDYEKIDWSNAGSLVNRVDKELILKTASERIWAAYYKYSFLKYTSDLTKYYMDRSALPVMKSCQHDYLCRIVSKIKGTFPEGSTFEYALWGITQEASLIHEEIQQQFERTNLVAVYDTYKSGQFLNKKISHPSEIRKSTGNVFYFVCAYGAHGAASKLFHELGIDSSRICIVGQEKRQLIAGEPDK